MSLSFDPELVIFDLDGTLIEFPHDYLYEQTARIIEELSWHQVEKRVLEDHFSAFDYFGFVEKDLRDLFIERFQQRFDHADFPAAIPLPGAADVLQKLKSKGIPVGIATARSCSEGELRGQLQNTGFLDAISAIALRTGSDGDWMDKAMQILSICQRLEIKPEKSIMIGDVPPDITSARQIGIGFTVAVLSGGIREDVLRKACPDLLLANVGELNYNSSLNL
jgi:phosphoglycolate phosphatase-like HAD superfamily hydrolase